MEKKQLTQDDADQITAAMFCMIHSAEAALNKLVQYYEDLDSNSDKFKYLCKQMGTARAKQWLHEQEFKIVTHVKKQALGRWLKTAHELQQVTELCTDVGLCSAHDGVTTGDLFDALLHDSNLMVRIFLLYGNMDNQDIVKLESTLKAFAKRDAVSQDVIDLFRPVLL